MNLEFINAHFGYAEYCCLCDVLSVAGVFCPRWVLTVWRVLLLGKGFGEGPQEGTVKGLETVLCSKKSRSTVS